MNNIALKRLRWRCRRGTKELDQLLSWYLAEQFPYANADTQAAFDALLDKQDPELWDWMIGIAEPADSRLHTIVCDIRAHYCF